MKDLDYIKNFSKISIKKVCEKKKVDRANLLSGRTTVENTKKVREEIESQIAKLYINRDELKEKEGE